MKCFLSFGPRAPGHAWAIVVSGALLVLTPAQRGLAQPAQDSAPTAPVTEPVVATQVDKAPRTFAFTVGGTYTFLNRLPLSASGKTYRPAGIQIGGRLGWQVRGLSGKAPGTIGFETNVLIQPARAARSSYGLIYGIFAKHSFAAQLRTRPFFSYGLGAAQVWVSEVHGRGIGHATRLAFGTDTRLRDRWHLSFSLTYQGIMMPSFALKDRPARDTSFHTLVLSTGFWFGA